MTSIDDLPLDTGQRSETPVPPSASSSPGPRVAVVAGLVIALAIAGWLFFPRSSGGPATPAAGTAPAAVQPGDAAPQAAPLPPLGEMDPVVRGLLSGLSTNPELLKWLASDDLVGSLATAIGRLAAGESPARDLAVLKPSSGFTTTRRDGVVRIDPASYARYRAIADLAANVDATKLAAAYTTLRPRLVEAYVAQGHPAASFDDAVRKAIATIRATPDAPADAAIVPAPGGYAYADPELERLPAAQKHLLRMGPDTVRAVRDAAARFEQALNPSATAK